MDDHLLRMLDLSRKGYYCSQIIIALGLEAQGKRDPDLVRAMAGLARGAGSGAGICGALGGAACLIGLYAGKGLDSEDEDEELWPMLAELWEWFAREFGNLYGGVTCGQILEGGAPRGDRCGAIAAQTYAKVREILLDHAFDSAEPRDG
jgi:hypothetical protein